VDDFRAARAQAWAELARLAAARRGDRDAAQVLRLARLHREAVADLALARRRWPGESVVDALEVLVSASHTALNAPGRPDPRALSAWLRRGAWQAMRASLPWAVAAAAVLVGAGLAGAAWVAADPVAGARVVSVSLRREIESGTLRAPVGPLAGALAFAVAAAGLVGAGLAMAWAGLELGGAAALMGRAHGAAAALWPVLAALPLLSGVVLAAAAGAAAGWGVLRGERREWPARLAEGAQVGATLAPLFVLGVWISDASVYEPVGAAMVGVAAAAAWWGAVVRLGRAS
jgi:hypothetical protein